VARLEWGPGGTLGRAVIGKVRPSLPRTSRLTSSLRSPFVTEPTPYGRLGPTRPKNACESLVLSIHLHLTRVMPELESIQWPRWFPIQMETKYYESGHCGGSPEMIYEGRLIISYPPPQLQDPNNNVIAFVRPTRPTRYQGIGDVYAELHFVRTAGHGMVVCTIHISNHQPC
jgi:hypothetical protein